MSIVDVILQQMLNSPQVKNNMMAQNAVDMYRKGDVQGLNQMMNNLCNERGTTPQDMQNAVRKRLGI